ncbi:MAG: Pr6Pr family membrane protein [Leifsonia sp.]
MAILEAAALAVNFRVLGVSAVDEGNFFCYFTIQSAICAVLVLTISGIIAITGRAEPVVLSTMRPIVLGYVILAGFVYAGLAIGSQGSVKPVEVTWSDAALHFVTPVLMIIDLIVERVLAKPTGTVPWGAVGWSLPYPSVWLVFTLVRGSMVGWFPYFFLDPAKTRSPIEMAGYLSFMLSLILLFSVGSIAITRIRPPVRRVVAVWEPEAMPQGVHIVPPRPASRGPRIASRPATMTGSHGPAAPHTVTHRVPLRPQGSVLAETWTRDLPLRVDPRSGIG